jgi:ABC-type dipeptide/oligopeptide/nickel transport system ATPase component
LPPARILGGQVRVSGQDVLGMTESQLRLIRGKQVAYVFQEPSTSLNPVFSVRSQLLEVLKLHRPDIPASERDLEMIRWLGRVGIMDPEKRLRDYPHQLSGGMQQRVMIAMALLSRPSLLVADEPTTALDVTIQAQIMDLLAELKQELGMSLLLITHNFGIIRKVATRVAVMYRGRIVEDGPVDAVINNPQHPYTRALIACVPRLGAGLKRLPTIDEAALAREVS